MLEQIDFNTAIKVNNQQEWEKIRLNDTKVYGGVIYAFPEKIPYLPTYISLIKLVGNTDIFPYFRENPRTISTHLYGWTKNPNIVTVDDFLNCT